MTITQLALVKEKQSIYGLKPEPDNQLSSKGPVRRAVINELDRAAEKGFRAPIQ